MKFCSFHECDAMEWISNLKDWDNISGKNHMPKFSCKSQIKSKEATDDWTNYQIGEKNLPNHMKKNANFNDIYQFNEIWPEDYPNVGRYLV